MGVKLGHADEGKFIAWRW